MNKLKNLQTKFKNSEILEKELQPLLIREHILLSNNILFIIVDYNY